MVLYRVNMWFKQLSISYHYPFVRFHLNDMMAAVIVLSYGSLLLNLLGKHSISDWKLIVMICAGCSFVWEYCARFLYPASTSDWIDILSIFLGGAIYWLFTNIIIKERHAD